VIDAAAGFPAAVARPFNSSSEIQGRWRIQVHCWVAARE
jgi:hypothetical protein